MRYPLCVVPIAFAPAAYAQSSSSDGDAVWIIAAVALLIAVVVAGYLFQKRKKPAAQSASAPPARSEALAPVYAALANVEAKHQHELAQLDLKHKQKIASLEAQVQQGKIAFAKYRENVEKHFVRIKDEESRTVHATEQAIQTLKAPERRTH